MLLPPNIDLYLHLALLQLNILINYVFASFKRMLCPIARK